MKTARLSSPFRTPRRRWYLALLALVLAAATSCRALEGNRVLVLGFDGLDPRIVDLLMSEDKMPNFARLRQGGAYGHLRSQHPMLSPILWTTIATGRSPLDHGIGNFVASQEQSSERLPVTSNLRAVKALWNLASESEKTVASVGWWATWPPEEINGWLVSDHALYHFLFEQGQALGTEDEETDEVRTYPESLWEELQGDVTPPRSVTPEDLSGFVHVDPLEFEREFSFEDELAHFRWAWAAFESHRQIGLTLFKEKRPDLTLVYFEGTDSTAHLFGHLFRAAGLQGDLKRQQERFGHAVEQMYLKADEALGDYLAALDANTTLVVISDHGFNLGQLHADPTRAHEMRRVSEKFHNLNGLIYLYGRGVEKRAAIDQATLFDITPTVLQLLQIPPSEEMPGRVLTEALQGVDPDGSEGLLTRVASWENDSGPQTRSTEEPGRSAATDQAVIERLEALGYLNGGDASTPASEPTSGLTAEATLAGIAFQEGRYGRAEEAYRKLLEQHPNNPALQTSLAGALGAQGRYQEAQQALDRAIELQPLNTEAYHNRAVIKERLALPDAAIEDYRLALRTNPQYAPSQQALLRLTGTSNAQAPKNETEARAFAIADQARQAAQRADYKRALELIDEASALSPNLALLHQYRSNISYLTGDLDEAARSLKRGLALSPEDPLLRENLVRLQKEIESRSKK